ncbi:hypothetical protein PU00_17565 [Hafnia alvei]|nr:hypothetical protein PU00_17565 [Hafnia alvei]
MQLHINIESIGINEAEIGRIKHKLKGIKLVLVCNETDYTVTYFTLFTVILHWEKDSLKL